MTSVPIDRTERYPATRITSLAASSANSSLHANVRLHAQPKFAITRRFVSERNGMMNLLPM
jgi:hypothetical protein